MGAFDRQIETALRLIQKYGIQCDWRKGDIAPSDGNKPWLGGARDATVKHPFICFLPATDGASGFGINKFRADSEVEGFSTFGLMGAQDFDPDVTDLLSRSGTPLVIKSIDTIKPADAVVLYILSIV